MPIIQELDSVHMQFHQEVAQAVTAAFAKDYALVDAKMPHIEELSNHVVDLITQLEQQIDRHHSSEFSQKVTGAKVRANRLLLSAM